MRSAVESVSTRYSTAGSMKRLLVSGRAIAVQRARALTPSSRIRTLSSQNVAIQSGTCAHRIATIAPTPAECVSAAAGAKRNHCNGVWCSQKSR